MDRQVLRRACLLGAAALTGYLGVVRPWHLRWGATDDEAQRPLPGDGLVPDANLVATRAITIDAPPGAVWPWLVQMGYGRAGWYSYDWLDNDGVHVTSIVPELQQLAVGDTLRTDASGGFRVEHLEPERVLVMMIRGASAGLAMDISSVILLEPRGAERTRVITRLRAAFRGPRERLWALLFDPGDFIMMRKTLLGLKQRAEALAASDPTERPLIDAVAPHYEFRGVQSIAVAAPPDQIFRAISQITPADIPLVNWLVRLRRLAVRLAGRPLPPPTIAGPISSGLAQQRIVVLAEAPGRELVVGMVGPLHRLLGKQRLPCADAKDFRTFEDPTCEKLAISWRLAGDGPPAGYTLTMEYRIHALSTGARWRFALSWLGLIKLGSTIIARLVLLAVKRHAECLAAAAIP